MSTTTLERTCTSQRYHHFLPVATIRLMVEDTNAQSHTVRLTTIGLHEASPNDHFLTFTSHWVLLGHGGERKMFAGKWQAGMCPEWHDGVLVVEPEMHDELNQHVTVHPLAELPHLLTSES